MGFLYFYKNYTKTLQNLDIKMKKVLHYENYSVIIPMYLSIRDFVN